MKPKLRFKLIHFSELPQSLYENWLLTCHHELRGWWWITPSYDGVMKDAAGYMYARSSYGRWYKAAINAA